MLKRTKSVKSTVAGEVQRNEEVLKETEQHQSLSEATVQRKAKSNKPRIQEKQSVLNINILPLIVSPLDDHKPSTVCIFSTTALKFFSITSSFL